MRFCILLALLWSFVLTAGTPVLEWKFEKIVNTNYLESCQATGRKQWLRGAPRRGAGVTGDALDCGPSANNFVAELNMPYRAFTIDLKFKLDNPVNPRNGNTLVWYALHSWGRSDFLFKITPKKELMAQFFTKDSKTGAIKLSYTVLSKPLDIESGRYYSVRVSSVSGGNLKIYFDGVLVAARDKAVSFCDLTAGNDPRYYPMLMLGGEARTAKPRFQLDGVIDDVRIYDHEVPMDDAPAGSPAGSAAAAPAAAAGDNSLPLSLTAGAVTAPFQVLDVDLQAGVVFRQAAKVFTDHAAHAEIKVQSDKLIVEFICPVSPAHPVERDASGFWRGEMVEFFWSPDPAAQNYYQFCCNVSLRRSDAIAWNGVGKRNNNWRSNFEVQFSEISSGYRVKMIIPLSELGIEPGNKSKVYRANFTRSGKSAGGRSTWAAVGQNFHNIDAFGFVISGTLADFLDLKFAELKQRIAGITLNEQLSGKLASLERSISACGNDPAKFAAAKRNMENFENEVVMHSLAGKKLIISQPDMWQDDIAPSLLTRPVRSFKVRMAQNSITFLPFAVSNMTDRRFLCRIKCMDTFPVSRFDNAPAQRFPLDGGFREAIPHDDNSGKSFYDALAPLPLGQLLRVAPKDTAAVWLTLSGIGIAPGVYRTNIVIKSATAGFDNEVIPLEVEVLPVDLASVETDTALYNYIQSRFVNTFSADPTELLSLLVARNVNYLYCNVPGAEDMDIYPSFDADGNIGECDFADLDNLIDSYIRCGMPKERIKLWFYLAMDYPGYCLKSNGKTFPFPKFSPQWQSAFAGFLRQLYDHCQSKYGISPERIVFCPVDEPQGDCDDQESTMYKACAFARFIKSVAPQARLMANPFSFSDAPLHRKNFARLAECFDILSPYSGQLTPGMVSYINSLKFKEVWTYNILQKFHAPYAYCRKLWENMHHGFSTVSTYWHVDQSDGGDAFCPFDYSGSRRNDYATIFADFSGGRGILSRRHEAYFLGSQDARLITLCRRLAQGKPEAARIESIIARGAEGDMSIIDECRNELLTIALQLGNR